MNVEGGGIEGEREMAFQVFISSWLSLISALSFVFHMALTIRIGHTTSTTTLWQETGEGSV